MKILLVSGAVVLVVAVIAGVTFIVSGIFHAVAEHDSECFPPPRDPCLGRDQARDDMQARLIAIQRRNQ